jgi:hypothetical protein
VEVFENGDTDGEGETYVGNTTATGDFTVTVSSLNDIYLTATATDAISGTSEFSAVFNTTPPTPTPTPTSTGTPTHTFTIIGGGS